MSELLAGLGVHWPAALGLAVGFPIALVILNELAFALARANHPLVKIVRMLRTWVVPSVAFALFLRLVLERPASDLWARLATTVVWVSIVIAMLGTVNTVVFERARPGSWQHRVPNLLRDLIRLLLVAAAAALVYSLVWDRELTGAVAALGVTSIVVGLALQEPLGNLFSGLMLLMERPFEVGDTIEVGTVGGVVKEINWRSAHLKSNRGVMQIVPNSTLNKEIISNFSRPRPIRLEEIEVAFSYDDPPNAVRKALLEVADTPGVLQDPPPIAATLAYGDSAVTYRLIYRTTEEDRWPVRNEVVTRIWYAARRHGLTMPYPIVSNLHYQQTESFGKSRPSALDQLTTVPGFPPLPADVVEELRTLTFGRGEMIFKEGDELRGVHLLLSGAVSLQVVHAGEPREIAAVASGQSFGEAGMYGVQVADLRAVALEDSEVLRLSPEVVRALFEASPRLARDTGHTLEVRRRALASVRAGARA
jgi:small-conductance mechanosensitive channel